MEKFFKHESSIVESSDIGDGTKILAFSHVCKGVKIGKNCIIGAGVYIGPNVSIGDNCEIQNNSFICEGVTLENDVYIGVYCLIGLPPEWKTNEDKNCGVIIKSRTRITGLVSIDSGANIKTIIGNNCYLMKHSHVGHDAQIGNNVTISCGAKIGGHSIIEDNCNIGLNAVIHQKITIPNGCMIGASAFVGKKSILKPGHKYAGVPIKEIGKNIR